MLSYGLGSRQKHAGMTNLYNFLKPHFSTASNAEIYSLQNAGFHYFNPS